MNILVGLYFLNSSIDSFLVKITFIYFFPLFIFIYILFGMNIKSLKLRWIKLFDAIDGATTEESAVEKGFEDLINHYSEKHRFYHKIEHISACLALLDEVESEVSDYISVEIAIWFHDVIYDPNKSNNEQQSAKYARTFLESINVSAFKIKKIEYLIMLTKHPSNPLNSDEKYLVDIDLSILGADTEHYDQYELRIRKEYKFVPNFLYRRGRKKVLNSFVDLGNIFQTESFQIKYEAQAKRNIKRALDQL